MLLNDADWRIAEDAESSPGLVLQPTANIVSVFSAWEPSVVTCWAGMPKTAEYLGGDG